MRQPCAVRWGGVGGSDRHHGRGNGLRNVRHGPRQRSVRWHGGGQTCTSPQRAKIPPDPITPRGALFGGVGAGASSNGLPCAGSRFAGEPERGSTWDASCATDASCLGASEPVITRPAYTAALFLTGMTDLRVREKGSTPSRATPVCPRGLLRRTSVASCAPRVKQGCAMLERSSGTRSPHRDFPSTRGTTD